MKERKKGIETVEIEMENLKVSASSFEKVNGKKEKRLRGIEREIQSMHIP